MNTAPVSEQLTVNYDNAEHRLYAELLLSNGFEMTVSPRLTVGLVFRHTQKFHIVELDYRDDPDSEGIFEPKLLICRRSPPNNNPLLIQRDDLDVPVYPEDYTEFEWHALQGDKPSFFEFLQREIYIWLRIRPHSLNTQIKLDHLT